MRQRTRDACVVAALVLASGCGFAAATATKADAPMAGSDAPAVSCTYPANPFGGHHYRVTTVEKTWDDGSADCASDGGHLVKIEAAEEQAFLDGLLAQATAWLGGRDHGGLVYQWADGTALGYTHWQIGEPARMDGCMARFGDTLWITALCGAPARAVCECDR
jgi:hypothetical protein